jgi:hypothetical protein
MGKYGHYTEVWSLGDPHGIQLYVKVFGRNIFISHLHLSPSLSLSTVDTYTSKAISVLGVPATLYNFVMPILCPFS